MKTSFYEKLAAKQREIIVDTPLASDHDFQIAVCEGKALRNPGKKIKFEKGIYFYSPNGKMVSKMRRNERAFGHAYGDVWEAGYGSRHRMQGSSLKELMQKIDMRYGTEDATQ